jgi:SEC-C motif-containing protein
MKTGRNDPCPCGSGRKYERCCLDRELEVVGLAGECERLVDSLGELAASRWPDAYYRAFYEFYRCGPESFGMWGASAEERFEAELWLVCDCDLGAGDTPLELELRERGPDAATLAALAFSRIRPWRIESVPRAGRIEANCPLTGEAAVLELARGPAGEAEPGRTIVARSVPLGEGRFVLLGRPAVVEAEVEDDFRDLIAGLDGADPASLLGAHGGTLASAARCWPVERSHTIEGELCTDAIAAWELRDLGAAIAALGREPVLEPIAPEDRDEPDVESWHLVAPPAQPGDPPAELGVRWRLCEEDASLPRRLARIDVDLYDGRLWLHAPSPERLAPAEREVRRLVGELMGACRCHEQGPPATTMRWQRERWEKLMFRPSLPPPMREELGAAA